MYSQESTGKIHNSSIITFPNREAVYGMINKASKCNIQQANELQKNCVCPNSLFETILTLLLLDEKNFEKNMFFVITALIFAN